MNKRSPASVAKALALLREMADVRSPYQDDAIRLRRELDPKGSPNQGFQDFLMDGNVAFEKKQWAKAAELYEKAVTAKTPKTEPGLLADVQDAIVRCYWNLASQLYQEKKVEEAITTAKKALKREYLQTTSAPKLAVRLLKMQHYQYQTAAEKTDAEIKAKAGLLAEVTVTANAIIQLWPGKEEGDAARVVLMQLALAQNNVAEADRVLREISEASAEYPTALMTMGYAHWNNYRNAKKQIEADEAKSVAVDKDRIAKRDEDRRLTVEYIEKAVKVLKPGTEGAPMPDALRECQRSLAAIYSEGKEFDKAALQYRPLIAEVLDKDSKKPLDDNALLIVEGAGQAYLQLNDVENVAAIGAALLKLGHDDAQLNRAILSLAIGVEKLRKTLAESDSGDPTPQESSAAKLKALTDLQEKVLVELSKRKELSPNDMTWIARTSANLGTQDAKVAAAE